MTGNEPTHEARAESSSLELCLTRRRKTIGQQALLAQMQDLGYSQGLCVTAIQILSQSKQAVSDMLAYIYDEQPSEEEFFLSFAMKASKGRAHRRDSKDL